MRSVVWLILVFVGAVVAATVLGRNDALVSFFYGSTRLDMSLNLFLISLLALVFLLFSGLQAINALLSLPVRAREWRALKRERAAHSALREALAELLAARYARAQRAAERALLLQAEAEVLHDDLQFTALAQLIAANGLHRLQDRRGRDDRLQLALALAQSRKSTGPSVAEGALLLSAEWALDDRDATRAMRELQALPAGVGRRTQALRLRLQATRQLRQPLEALQTARLLAKHQAFSPMAAQSLLRSLAIEALNDAHDDQQLQQVWERLDNSVRRDAFVVARAARRAQALGNVALGRQWLQPLWEQIGRSEADERLQLAMALVDCAPGLGSDWLPRIEAALAQFGHEPALVAAAAMAFADRQLWGKARRPLEQTASAASLPAAVRRQALRCLAGLAREEGHEDRAAAYDQRAAMID
ncbi:MAG: porphyrin biosynthesis protein [Burkholderiales bacterium PBB6]|nr:MAG: porphyrin biosynthesis protein [Burkholderiales bacterium PBB6]